MTPEEAVQRLNTVLAHAWMVRTFLKHADEIQDDEELLDVPRTVFDYVRAVEPAFQRRDFKEFLHRIKGKLPKLRRVAELFAVEHRRVSDHTNYQMAAASLTGCVRQIEEILAAVGLAPSPLVGEGGGGGAVGDRITPHPNPPPQGGREPDPKPPQVGTGQTTTEGEGKRRE